MHWHTNWWHQNIFRDALQDTFSTTNVSVLLVRAQPAWALTRFNSEELYCTVIILMTMAVHWNAWLLIMHIKKHENGHGKVWIQAHSLVTKTLQRVHSTPSCHGCWGAEPCTPELQKQWMIQPTSFHPVLSGLTISDKSKHTIFETVKICHLDSWYRIEKARTAFEHLETVRSH